MQVWNVSCVAHWKYRVQKSHQKSPSGHLRTTLSGCIFATKARINNWKNLFSSNMSSRCPHNMVNFGPLANEIAPVVWAPQLISMGFALGSVTARQSSSGRQPNFAALNRGRHLCSAGRPSCWALAHTVVFIFVIKLMCGFKVIRHWVVCLNILYSLLIIFAFLLFLSSCHFVCHDCLQCVQIVV